MKTAHDNLLCLLNYAKFELDINITTLRDNLILTPNCLQQLCFYETMPTCTQIILFSDVLNAIN